MTSIFLNDQFLVVSNWSHLFWLVFFILFLFFGLIVAFGKYEYVNTKEPNDHANNLKYRRPLIKCKAGDYHLPCTLLIINSLHRPCLSKLKGQAHEDKGD